MTAYGHDGRLDPLALVLILIPFLYEIGFSLDGNGLHRAVRSHVSVR